MVKDSDKEDIKTLKPEEAFKLFQKNYPLKFTVSSKFSDDHMLDHFSKKAVIDASAARYWKNKVTKCSWNNLNSTGLVALAKRGEMVPSIHGNSQQLSIKVKADEKICEVTEWDPKKDGKNGKSKDVKERAGKPSVTVDVKEVVSEYELVCKYVPEEGTVEIYHYEKKRGGQTNIDMLPKYLRWIKSGGEYTAWKEKRS